MDDMKKLGEKLAKDGLLEYISVPWKNHRSGDPEKYKDLTVNLALWFIHILAGNDYEISWDYGALISETLGTKTITSSTAPKASQLMSNPEILAVSQEAAISSGTRLPSGKHRREEPCEDPIHFSFSESQQLRTQVYESRYVARFKNSTDVKPSQQVALRNRVCKAILMPCQRVRERVELTMEVDQPRDINAASLGR